MQQQLYKIHVNNRNYSSWEIYETTNFQKMNLSFELDPFKNKLFSNDVFCIKENKIEIIHSTIRSEKSFIPGVLILEKTYGKIKNKSLYKCIPDDTRLLPFLIPYEIKHAGFSKVLINLYVTFSYTNWNEKHPNGILNLVIGPINILDNFYEYQLYCKSLNSSIQKFHKDTLKIINSNSHDTFIENIKLIYPCIENRIHNDWKIFTIDPLKSVDLDDGFSIKKLENNIHQISIYISNVTIWMDVLKLWDSFSQRISTIYLPDKKRPMLPTILSDCICSLLENTVRVAFTMDIFIQNNEIIDIKYCNSLIKVYKNYCYEEPELLKDINYKMIFDVTKKISKKVKYTNIKNSHDIVCYLMILMNYNCAKIMLENKTGILRSTIINKKVEIPENLPEDVGKFIQSWNSSCGQYIDGSKINEKSVRHELLDMDAYIHITSPIRRLVDLLNIIKLQQITNLIELSENSNEFYNKWINNLEYINTTMRSIKKVQNDCSLLDLCSNNIHVMEKEYNGYIFDKIYRNDNLYQYIVFLPELKLTSRITLRENYENYEIKKFKLFLFHNEERFKKKIRIQII
jgi:exoribonuclease R